MIYVENNETEKYNFIDENDVFVGYSMKSLCCEDYGWFITDARTDVIPEVKEVFPNFGLDGYFFDIAGLTTPLPKEVENGDLQHIIVLSISHESKPTLFLHLFNVQNGYYSHEAVMTQGSNTIFKTKL